LPLLECKNLTKDFGGLVALKRVSLSMSQGEIVGLIVPNGVGKTTLFNLITGTYRPDDGQIFLNGEDITRLKPHDIVHRGVARTFQSVRPFLNLSVFQNVRIGGLFGEKGDGVDKRIEKALDVTGLSPKRDTIVRNLPIEGRKLVEVARALASSPSLLLLDEPIAGLNPVEVGKFIDLVKTVHSGGASILIVEHVMRAIMSVSHRIVVMHHGEKLAEGKPQEIASNEQVIQIYLGEKYA
jgi:branched-chain amino acid transport system ATP-binding protein